MELLGFHTAVIETAWMPNMYFSYKLLLTTTTTSTTTTSV